MPLIQGISWIPAFAGMTEVKQGMTEVNLTLT